MKTKQRLLGTLSVLFLVLSGCGENDGKSSSSVYSKDEDDSSSVTTPVPAAPKQAGWYAKTTVSATADDGTLYSYTTAGIFGELVESSAVQDHHDIPAYTKALLRIVMLPEFSTESEIGYFSEYQHFDEESETKKVWTFQVRNEKDVDLSNAPLRIGLEGVYDVFYKTETPTVSYNESKTVDSEMREKLSLVDIDNGLSYSAEELASANLTMTEANGDPVHTRTFRWVLGAVDPTDYAPLQTAARKSVAFRSSASTVQDFKPAVKPTTKFGLPPL